MRAWVVGLAAAAWVVGLAPGAYALQDRAAVQAVRVSRDSVGLGDAFTLRATVYLPPGRDLRVPATLLPEWGVESLGRVRVESVVEDDGSARAVIEYGLIPFEAGLAATPQLEMASGDAARAAGRVRVMEPGVPSADAGSTGTAVDRTAPNDANGVSVAAGPPPDRLVVAGRRVLVTSPMLLEDLARGPRPRPPAGVVGANWNLPAVLGASVLSLLLLGVATLQARDWRATREASVVPAGTPPETPEVWRERALAELDRLLARGHHRAGRPRDFYEGASDVVRGYLACFDPAWSRSRTSTELMRRLSADADWPDPAALVRAVARGEVAKFARAGDVPGGAAATAERDGRTMRAWIDRSGRAPAFARMRAALAGEGADGEAGE